MRNATTNERCEQARARRLATLALLAWIAAAGAAWASPQGAIRRQVQDQACPGEVSGYLGITGLACPPCSVTIRRVSNRWQPAWLFAIEPTITEIAPGSPADGVLRTGDEILGIDGVLITSADGGRRLANIRPDTDVTLRYRRGGRSADAVLRARPRCGQFVEGMSTSPFTWPSVEGYLQLEGGVRIDMADPEQRNVTIATPRVSERVVVVPRGGVVGGVMSDRPRALFLAAPLGLRWSCDAWSAKMKDGRRVWKFSAPVRVAGVEIGGPADAAGVRKGDAITAVDGQPITSDEAGEAFANVQAERPIQLTLRGSDDQERTVTIVPVAAPARGAIKRSR